MTTPNPAARAALDQIAVAEPVLLKGVEPGKPGDADLLAPEPVYDESTRRDIQGNIIPGFNKDRLHFLFFRIGDVEHARHWIAAIAPMVRSMDEVVQFVRQHRARRLAEGVREPQGLRATWVSVAFSHAAIATLAGPEAAAQFGEESFRQGLAARSAYLGDPTSAEYPRHRDRWLVGGPHNAADVLVIVAADNDEDLKVRVDEIRERSAQRSRVRAGGRGAARKPAWARALRLQGRRVPARRTRSALEDRR